MADDKEEKEVQQDKYDEGPSNNSKHAQNYREIREGSLSVSSSLGVDQLARKAIRSG
ncbi:hypothetical protein HAX54_038047, partial [Datura stramonium]|nr:hypothetical protein [Datura stramonium]